MAGVLIGRDRAELRCPPRGPLRRTIGSGFLEARAGRWVMGTFDEARAVIAAFADAGAERLMLQTFLPFDVEHVRVMGELIAA